MTVYRNVTNYNANGTSHNQTPGRSGRQRTGRSAANIEAVRHAFQNHPDGTISSRRNGLGIPSATFKQDYGTGFENFHPYQMIKHHQLLPGDRQRRLQFCQWLLDRPDRFLEDLLIGDEAGFAMNAMVNTHNIRAYRPHGQPPVEFDYQRNNSRLKVTTWVGLMGNGTILGPVFFDENVNGPRYLAMINEQVVPALANERRYRRQGNGRFRRVWWAQDGAPCHRNRATTDRLTELFGERVIALNRPVEWPPRSPGFFPLGPLEVHGVCHDHRQTFRRWGITVEVEALRQDRGLIRRAVGDMLTRARKCVEREGGYVDD